MMPGLDPRQMQAMMRRMGIQMQDIDGVIEVVVRTRTKEYRIKRPSVSIMKAQGSETWQVQGKATEVAIDAAATPPASTPTPAADAAPAPVATNAPPPLPVSEDDVRLVMKQTGKDAATCRKALEAAGGDLAEAIVALSG